MSDLRLHEAAAAGDVAAIERLFAEGADLDARDGAGRTPVMAATLARQTEAVRALLEAGADVDIRDDRLDNPFLYAGAEGLLDILKLANEAGADPAITNRFGGIALIPASERGHVEVVRYLLDETRRGRRPRQQPRLDGAARGGDPRPRRARRTRRSSGCCSTPAPTRSSRTATASRRWPTRGPAARPRSRRSSSRAARNADRAGAGYPISSRFASEASIVLRPTSASLNADLDLLVVAGQLRGDHDPVAPAGVADAVAVAVAALARNDRSGGHRAGLRGPRPPRIPAPSPGSSGGERSSQAGSAARLAPQRPGRRPGRVRVSLRLEVP